jgi:hypothetical protein
MINIPMENMKTELYRALTELVTDRKLESIEEMLEQDHGKVWTEEIMLILGAEGPHLSDDQVIRLMTPYWVNGKLVAFLVRHYEARITEKVEKDFTF